MTENKRHLHLLDLLKISVLIAIQILHTLEFVFFDDYFSMGGKTLFELSHYFARFFTLGGQILVAIIYFLFGLKTKTRKALFKIAGFAFLGQMILGLIFMDGSFLSGLEWDIYSFIGLTNLLLLMIPEKNRSSLFLILGSFLILLIPPSFWHSTFPQGYFFDILAGRKTLEHTASWAIFPWFFHCVLFLGIGAWVNDHRELFSKWNKSENVLWAFFLLCCLPWLGFYYKTPVGPNYYNFNFNQDPWVYWANFLPNIFIMRMALISSIQDKLHTQRFCRWVSSLMWSRRLGLTYLVSVIYVGIGANFDEYFLENPIVLDLYFLSIMPLSEMIVRILIKLKTRIAREN